MKVKQARVPAARTCAGVGASRGGDVRKPHYVSRGAVESALLSVDGLRGGDGRCAHTSPRGAGRGGDREGPARPLRDGVDTHRVPGGVNVRRAQARRAAANPGCRARTWTPAEAIAPRPPDRTSTNRAPWQPRAQTQRCVRDGAICLRGCRRRPSLAPPEGAR